MGARSMSVHMQGAEPGLSSDSRGAPRRSRGAGAVGRLPPPLLVPAASGSQIESAPTATMQESDRRAGDGSWCCGRGVRS
jgi:hypothetical protein